MINLECRLTIHQSLPNSMSRNSLRGHFPRHAKAVYPHRHMYNIIDRNNLKLSDIVPDLFGNEGFVRFSAHEMMEILNGSHEQNPGSYGGSSMMVLDG